MESRQDQQSEGQRVESSGEPYSRRATESSAEQEPFSCLETERWSVFSSTGKWFRFPRIFSSIFSRTVVAHDFPKEVEKTTLCVLGT